MDYLRDRRECGWFYLDNAIIDRFGPILGPRVLAVYVVLCRHAGADQTAFPSTPTIDKELGTIGRRHVADALTQLQDLGLINVQRRTMPNGAKTSNLYTLLRIPESLDPCTPQGQPPVPTGDNPLSPTGTTPCPPQGQAIKEDSIEQDSNEGKKGRGARPLFNAPTLDEARAYFHDHAQTGDNAEDYRAFWHYYESNGWMVGKNKMKNWQAAASGWADRSRRAPVGRTGKAALPPGRSALQESAESEEARLNAILGRNE